MVRHRASDGLTPRDLEVLQWIGRAGIAAEDQLHRRFWSGRRLGTAHERLQQLVHAGYLRQQRIDTRQAGEVVYTLTPTGRQLFPPDMQKPLLTGLPAAGEIQQQLVAQDAYAYLEQEVAAQGGRILAWHGERALRSRFYRASTRQQAVPPPGSADEIPDAQVEIAGANGLIQVYDIEIDGQYHGQMLRTKLTRFGTGGRPTLWICTSLTRSARIQRAASAYPNIRVITLTAQETIYGNHADSHAETARRARSH